MANVLAIIFNAPIMALLMTLAVCAIFRNEAPYLREGIEFHRMVGVECRSCSRTSMRASSGDGPPQGATSRCFAANCSIVTWAARCPSANAPGTGE